MRLCPFRYGNNSFFVARYSVGKFIYVEHPKGCSLQLFYLQLFRKECGSAHSVMGTIRSSLHAILWVNLFTWNTQRDVPYSCSIYSYSVRNAALPIPLWEQFVYRHRLLCGWGYLHVPPTIAIGNGPPSFLQAKKKDRFRYNLVYRKKLGLR